MRLLVVRKTLGMSAATIAKTVGVRQATWSSWETGATRPYGLDEVVTKIAAATGVDRNWLMWGNTQSVCITHSEQISLFDQRDMLLAS